MTTSLEHNFGLVSALADIISKRPDPRLMALGDTFTNEFTGEVYTVVRDAFGNHVWILSMGGAAASGQSYFFLGSLSGDSVPVSGFIGNTFAGNDLFALRYPVLESGTIRSLRIFVDFNSMDSASQVFVSVNGGPTGLFIVVPAGSTGGMVATVDVPVVAGDTVDVYVTNGTGGGRGNSLEISAGFKIS